MSIERTTRLFVRVSTSEKSEMKQASQASSEALSNWIRKTLIAAARKSAKDNRSKPCR
jgi:uncharacterized protein (DUF1778 family)